MIALALHMIVAAEIFSDLTVAEDFQDRALAKRHSHFWNVVESAAAQNQYEEAVAGLYACLDDVPECQVKKILEEALSHLDIAARQQGGQRSGAARVADQALSDGPTATMVTGPSDFFAKLYGAFVAEERKSYQEKLRGQVMERQKRVTQILKDSQRADVLTSTRLATKLAFDAQKYDIYNRGVPKTTAEAKAIADKIVELSGKLRKAYLGVVTAIANQITEDVEGLSATPSKVRPEDLSLGRPEDLSLGDGVQFIAANKVAV
jgi:hypothetical protein